MSTESSCCLIVELREPRREAAAWQEGPLPAPLPQDLRPGAASATDLAARRSYFTPPAAQVLYGTDEPRRWHRPEQVGEPALELQQSPDATTWWLVVHLPLPEDATTAVMQHRAAVLNARGAVPAQFAPAHLDLLLVDRAKPRIVSHVVPRDVRADWMHVALGAVTGDVTMFDSDDPELSDGVVHLSADWRALGCGTERRWSRPRGRRSPST